MGRAPSRATLAVALALVLGACTAENPSATPTPTPTRDPNALNVTALLDLSGSREPSGAPQRDALQMWADQHSAGTPRVKLKIVDVAGSPAKTALELRREVGVRFALVLAAEQQDGRLGAQRPTQLDEAQHAGG